MKRFLLVLAVYALTLAAILVVAQSTWRME